MSKETQYPNLELNLTKGELDKIINAEVLKINGQVFISELKTKTMVADFAKEQVAELQTERDSLKEQVEALKENEDIANRWRKKWEAAVNLTEDYESQLSTLQEQADKLAEAIEEYLCTSLNGMGKLREALSTYKQSKH